MVGSQQNSDQISTNESGAVGGEGGENPKNVTSSRAQQDKTVGNSGGTGVENLFGDTGGESTRTLKVEVKLKKRSKNGLPKTGFDLPYIQSTDKTSSLTSPLSPLAL